MALYEKGNVRIHYQEAGSGFPLFVIPGGGQNSTIGFMSDRAPFNATEEFKDEYRCITADLRNAPSGQSSGPLEMDRQWDSYADDHLALMDHLGIPRFMVIGYCIGGPFIWKLVQRAPERIVAAVVSQPVGFRKEANPMYDNSMQAWGPTLVKQRPDLTMDMIDKFLTRMYVTNADFVFSVPRPRPGLPGARAGHAGRDPFAPLRTRHRVGDAGTEVRADLLPVERHEGEDPAGGAARAHVPQGEPA